MRISLYNSMKCGAGIASPFSLSGFKFFEAHDEVFGSRKFFKNEILLTAGNWDAPPCCDGVLTFSQSQQKLSSKTRDPHDLLVVISILLDDP